MSYVNEYIEQFSRHYGEGRITVSNPKRGAKGVVYHNVSVDGGEKDRMTIAQMKEATEQFKK